MPFRAIHDLVRASAERRPEHVAVDAGRRRLTYRELVAGSGRLARRLLADGVRDDSIVALFGDDSVEMITAILAVLQAGAIYMPLDPRLPDRRLRAMLEQVPADRLLAEAGLEDRLAALAPGNGARVLPLAAPRGGAGCERIDQDPDRACYVVFTSGSTGVPKGIVGRLRGIDHFVRWEIGALGLGETARVSQLTTPSFDAFLRDVFVPLAAGGTVCVPPGRETVLDAGRLAAWLEAAEVEVMHCVPSLFRTLLAEPLSAERFPRLAWVLLAGEALLPADVRRWQDVFGERVRLVNLYGASETTMTKLVYFVEPGDGRRATIPIGRPMPGARAVVVGEDGKPCPPRTVGEIYVRTPFRSRGYYGRPELTARAFIPNPFGNDPKDVVYRTGDLGRRLEDGNFEFVGRRDQQVKVRGQRVELAEISEAIYGWPGVTEAAVVGREDGTGETVLHAYLSSGEAVDVDGLRRFLGERLPEVMVPSAVVVLDELPHTTTGKVDLRALPEPAGRPAGAPYEAPRGSTEELVAAVWQEVLGVERAGRGDDFFALGGHSLLAARVAARLRRALDVELPLNDLFEAPRLASLARRIDELAGDASGRRLPPLEAAPRDRALPLSFGQERLWILDRLDPGRPAYNVPIFLALRGALDPAALERALGLLVERHESLRTVFPETADGPEQRVLPAAGPPLARVDLLRLPPAERRTQLTRLARDSAGRPFDLARGPLVRARLVTFGEREHALFLVAHHIVIDNWSAALVVRDVTAFYRAALAGDAAGLPPLPVQYADYTVWQRRWLTGELLDSQVEYWRESLHALPVLELPTDRPRRGVQRGRGARAGRRLSAALRQSLETLSRERQATLFMTLLAGFAALLERLGQQADVPVGTPITHRARPELEEVVGFFVNTLVMRCDVSGDPTGRELLERLRSTALGAYAHQDVPFEKLVDELAPERDLSRQALFQVMFVFHDTASAVEPGGTPRHGTGPLAAGDRLEGVEVKPLESEVTTAAFDLTLVVARSGDGLLAAFDYDADLFHRTTIERLLGQLEALLTGLAAAPESRLSHLDVLSAAERHQLLVEWGGADPLDAPETPDPSDPADLSGSTLHGLFAARVRRTPDAVAVDFEDRQVTYGELARRAGAVARSLAGGGVVAVVAERTPETLASLLGVLQAGAAYLPVDPGLPEERLRWILDDAGATVLPRAGATPRDPPSPPLSAAPSRLAYVIYTSGSTGRPKGVMVAHREVCATLDWRRRAFGLGPGVCMLQNIPWTFDPSIWQIFGALHHGGRLVLAGDEEHRDATRLARTLAERRVTVTDFPPSMLRVLVDAGAFRGTPALRLLFAGGEALPGDLRESFLEQSGAELRNIYGPTEAAIDTSSWRCRSEPGTSRVPIGRPITGKTVVLLDRRARPVAAGLPGELCAGGLGLARGYLGRPRRTAEKFVPDPRGAAPGARLYRTGDLARWRRDGLLEFLGRADGQVKIRGQRLELGEIEAFLAGHPGVAEAVVAAREREPGDLALAAWIVPTPDADAAALARELPAYLGRRLPAHMVPGAFETVPRLPVTAHGKVDRDALPAPDFARTAARPGYRPPRTPAEEVVAGIFADVLAVERAGADDSFFELGGHSLLATRALARIREVFDVELSLRALFESPTVAGLAAAVEAARRAGGEPPPPIVAAADEGPAPLPFAPLSFAQQRLWFLDRLQPGSAAYNIAESFGLTGPLDEPALGRALGEIVRRHQVLRSRCFLDGADPVQEVLPVPDTVLWRSDLSRLAERDRRGELTRRVRAEAGRPFDLERGPLYRFALLRLGPEEHALLITFHHIASDGWSMGVFFRELAALYRGFAGAEGARRPPEPAVQYADLARWQQRWLRGDVLDQQIAFWREELAGAPRQLALPTDRPRRALRGARGGRRTFRVPGTAAGALRALARREQATLFMSVLAGFCGWLHRLTGQDDLLVGAPIAGRAQPEVQDLIGFFVNTLVIRSELAGRPAFRDLVRAVRGRSLGAYAHAEVPFEKIVEELQPERDLSRTPLFQVLFDLADARPRGEGTLASGVQVHRLPAGDGAAKFELEVSLADTGEGLSGSLRYNAELFDRSTAERLARGLEAWLGSAAAGPDRRLADLSWLGAAERHQLVAEWNDTAVETRDRHATLADLLAGRAARDPEAVAIYFEDQHLSYGELHRRARVVARRLRRAGVGPEDCVGIYLERSSELLVALAGTLAAGAAYLPLDPDYPRERLEVMVRDAAAPLLLSSRALADGAARLAARSAGESRPVLLLDEPALFEGSMSDSEPVAPGPGNLAYVIYTSGSTGRPKGVMNTHRAIVNRLRWMQAAYRLSRRDRVLQKTPMSFDVSVWELFWPLLEGAGLVVAEPGGHRDSGYLSSLIDSRRVTTLHFVPSMLQVFLEEPALDGPGDPCRSVRQVVTSGEALPLDLAHRCLERLVTAELHNLYGPTEAAVDVTFWPCRGDRRDFVPIGRPISNVAIHLAERSGGPAPLGVPGELLIGGVGLARGYLGRPALTAEKFVPDPFAGGEPGARLYRSGDLTRRRPAGEIEFLGRIDHQVKIRGFRIELAEIEAVLARHPGVREAVVIVRDAGGGPRLAAFFTTPGDRVAAGAGSADAPERGELQRFVESKLPRYMVPSDCVRLDAFPLTPSGKADRRALARLALPAGGAVLEESERVPPRERLELELIEIWEELLGVHPIGVNHDFFELGGHSLLAVRLLVKVEERFDFRLPLASFFQASTVASLAQRVRERGEAAPDSPLVAIQPRGERPPLFCMHPAGGHVFSYVPLAHHLGWDQPVYGLQDPSTYEEGPPRFDVVDAAALYIEAIRQVQPAGPYSLCGWSLGGAVAFEMARQLEARGEEVARLVILDTAAPDFRAAGERDADQDEIDLVLWFVNQLALAVRAGDLRGMDLDERLSFVLDRAHELGRLPSEVGLEQARHIFRLYQTEMEAERRYLPAGPCGVPTVVFRAEQHDEETAADMTFGWSRWCTRDVDVEVTPGTHHTMVLEPHTAVLAERLREYLPPRPERAPPHRRPTRT